MKETDASGITKIAGRGVHRHFQVFIIYETCLIIKKVVVSISSAKYRMARYHCWRSVLLVLALFAMESLFANSQAVVSVAQQTDFVVHRPGQFTILVTKTGQAQLTVIVVIEIVNATIDQHSDFVGTSQSIAFPAGVEDLMTSATFTVTDDGRPEPDYTYTIQMRVASGDAVISQLRMATVTIVANNNPFGVFGFQIPASPISVVEPLSGGSNLSLVIERRRGTSGAVSVTYKIYGNQTSAISGLDVTPASGSVLFQAGQSRDTIDLQIISDQIPENDETFTVELMTAEGGYSIDPTNNRPRINASYG